MASIQNISKYIELYTIDDIPNRVYLQWDDTNNRIDNIMVNEYNIIFCNVTVSHCHTVTLKKY